MATARRRRTSAACWPALKPDIILSTKVRVPAERPISAPRSRPRSRRACGGSSATMSMCSSCTTRSRRAPTARRMSVEEVLERGRAGARSRAREQGKTRFIGFTAIGETAALHRADRIGRVRQRAGALQRAQSERRARRSPRPIRRRTTAASSTSPRSRRRHHRHPRARGRRAVGPRGAQSARPCRWSSRSARVRAMRRTWRARAGSSRWCARAMPAA